MAPSSANPYVELLHSDLDGGAVVQGDKLLGSPKEQIETALLSYRLMMINHVKGELQKQAQTTGGDLLRLLDVAGQLYLGKFNRMVGPIAAAAYVRAYRHADAGDVPMTMIYALADQHADRMGKYYNDTSRDALLQGFNAMVNKNIPARVAADRAMDAYGLTPRQMSGYVSIEAAKQVKSAQARPIKARMLEYIGRSIRSRMKVFAEQELHNLDLQAQQTAWMWLQDKGKLSENAEKVWITAKDERVCKQCGPMHGKRVGITERFLMPDKSELYVPGAHPNCRCEVKVTDRLIAIGKAVDFEEHEHPRRRDGRFTSKTKLAEKPVADYSALQRFLDTAETEQPKVSMGQTSPVRMGQVRMGGVAMGGVSMSLPKVSMTAPETGVKMGLAQVTMPIELKVKTQLATQRVVMEQLQAAKPKKRRVFYRPTIKLDKPAYAIVSAYEIDQHGKIELDHNTEFFTDESAIAHDASDYFHHQIEGAVEEISYNHANYLEMTTKDGARLNAEISDEDVWEVVSYVAFQNGSDPDWKGGGHVRLAWQDEDGNHQFVEKISYDQAAEHLGLHPEQFEVFVVRLDEGHDSSLGETIQLTAGTKHGHEQWVTSGQYQTEYAKKSQVGYSAPISFLDLVPDVDNQEFGDHPDD